MPRWTVALCLFAPLGVLLCTCGAELPGPRVCTSQSSCGRGRVCVLGRCRKASRVPVSVDSKRLIFTPEDWTKLSSRGSRPSPDRAEVITLGDPQDGDVVLLLRFAVKLPPKARLHRALLVMDPMPQCTRLPGRIHLELSHVLSPWRSGSISWSRQPDLGLPMRASTVTATPPLPVRLDVTELVREWGEHRGRYYGLGLNAAGSGPGRACFTTGLTWGTGPRLEVFLAPEKKKRKRAADAGADAVSDAGADGGRGTGEKDERPG